MLSPYKTPILPQRNSIKKGNLTTSRYKLPFQKQQSEQQKRKATKNKQQVKSVVGSELDSPRIYKHNRKESTLQKQSRKSEIQTDEVQIQVSVENKQEKCILDNLKIYSKQIAVQIEPKIFQVPKLQIPEVPKENHETQTQNYQVLKKQQLQKLYSVQSKLSIDRTHQFKLQPIQAKLNHNEASTIQYNKLTQQKKKKYRSRSRYLDSQIFEDIQHQSDKTNSHSLITKRKEMPRIVKSQKLREVKPALDRSLKKLEKQLWQILLNLNQQQQQIGQVNKKRKKSKFKQLKRNQSKLDQPKQHNSSQFFGQKFPELSSRKTLQQSINIDYDMYDQLPTIQQNIIKPQFFRGQSNSILNKLQSLIELKQKSKKCTITLPIQKYLQQCQFINKINPFFKKLNQFGGCLLLSIGKLMFLDSGNLVFTQGEHISHLCIIILGKVLLSQNYNSFKYYSMPGESLGEEALFDQSRPYNIRIFSSSKCIEYKTQGKAISKVCILRISLRKYYKLSIELNSAGEKRLFNLIDNLFKINYLKKNAIVHNQLKQKLQNEVMACRKNKSSFYFS